MFRFLSDVAFRLKALVRRDDAERDLEQELAFHMEMDAAALRAKGIATDDAEREARRRIGSVRRQAEQAREGWGVARAYEFLGDVRHALRQMRRRPGFSAIVVLTLGLGIGATVALFSVVNDLLLRPLPYRNEQRIHAFWMSYSWRGEEYDFVRQEPGVFEHMAAFSTNGAPYTPTTSGTGAEVLTYVVATPSLFDVLGTRPLLGRAFTPDEDRPGAAPVIVISHGMWQKDLGGAADVIGHRIMIDGAAVTVIGVMPPGFYFPSPDFRAWRPLQLDPNTGIYRAGFLSLVTRSRAGTSPELVNADVQRIAARLGERFTYPEAWDKTKNANAVPIREQLIGGVRDPLLLLLAAVALLLLIACANAAALVLARNSDRTGEMAVRTALGAGHWRLARQVVAESLVLAGIAAVVGATLAAAGFTILVARLPLRDFSTTVAVGWPTVGAAFGLALVIALSVSIAPVRNLLRGGAETGVNRERSEAGLRRGTRRIHNGIIVGQVAVAVLLIVGATLLIRSVDRIQALDPGFDASGVMTMNLIAGGMTAQGSHQQFFRDVVDRVSAMPGVEAVGLTNRLALRDQGFQGPVEIEGRPDLSGARRPNALYRLATPGFAAALRMRLVQGRGIDSTDIAGNRPVVVINESFARRMWPNESPLGRRVTSGFAGGLVSREVIGVVRDIRMLRITDEAPATQWIPFEQSTVAPQSAVIAIRTSGNPVQLVAPVRAAVAALNPQIAVTQVASMEQVVATSLAQPLQLRFFLGIFAMLALALGTVGVYGVVAYAVARRRAELAIRMALGATPGRVLREVVAHGLTPVAAGVTAGLLAAAALTGLLERFLYGIAPSDPASLVIAATVLLAAGTCAALIPGARAAMTSPVRSLRAE